MRICLFIEGQENVTWDQWVALARASEEHGFEGLFRSDHYMSFGHPAEWGTLDAWATLAALASLTGRIHLGTLVSPVTFRHPSELAKSVVTVDHASGGRVELAMGAGWNEAEHRAYGFPFPPTAERIERLEEQVEIVHRLWDRDEVTFEGKHYRLEAVHGLPKPVQEPHPNLIVGGAANARSAALAARWADEYNMNFEAPDVCRGGRERLSAACEAIGRDPASLVMSLANTVLVGADRRELEARASRLMERRGQTGDIGAYIEGMKEDRIVGTTGEVLDRLAEFADAGVERVMMQHLLHDDLEAVALIGQEIIPAVADL
jgi:F420-dependent oxidoreductase-like protein